MRRSINRALSAVAVTLAAAVALPTSAALAAPVEMSNFTLTPACTSPGGAVAANVTLTNTTWFWQTTYVQTELQYYGVPVMTTAAYGPFFIPPFFSFSPSLSRSVPPIALWGPYTVIAGDGPSSGNAMNWSSQKAGVWIEPYPICSTKGWGPSRDLARTRRSPRRPSRARMPAPVRALRTEALKEGQKLLDHYAAFG